MNMRTFRVYNCFDDTVLKDSLPSLLVALRATMPGQLSDRAKAVHAFPFCRDGLPSSDPRGCRIARDVQDLT